MSTLLSLLPPLALVLSVAGSSYYWWRSLAHRSPLGQSWPLRSALSGWFFGRQYFTDEGWRYRTRAFWLPLLGLGSAVLLWAALPQR